MNSIFNTMKYFLQLNLAIVCGLMLVAIAPVMADTSPQGRAQGNPNGAVWEEWQPLAQGFVARRAVPERLELPREQRRPAGTQVRVKAGIDRRPWEPLSVWLYTDTPGLYSVNLDEVSAGTGIPVNRLHAAANSGRLSFFNEEEPVSWYYDAQHGRLLFVGEHYETFYAEGNAYQLVQTWRRDRQQMAVRGNLRANSRGNNRARVPAGQQTPFREVLHFEEESDMMFFLWLNPSNPDARYWFWDLLFGSVRPRLDIPLHIPDPSDYGTARIRVRLHGRTDMYPGDDHGVFAELNGYAVGSVLTWDGFNPAELVADFHQSILNVNGDNILTLNSDYDAARPFPGQLLESVTVEYDRMPVAVNGQLWIRNVERGTQEVSGFTSDEIIVIESPVRNAAILRDISVYQDWDGGWAVSFQAAAGIDYLIAEPAALLSPELDAREQARLKASGNAARYLIVAPREFAGTAQALAELRRAGQGAVKIVWLDDIYKEFSAGRTDPFAIGRFMDHVRTYWSLAPTAVTLIGKGSLDRKDAMGYGDNFLPLLMTASPWQLAPSDDRLLGSDDGVPPFAVGRLPITSDEEGLAYVDKLRTHEMFPSGDAAYKAVVVADNPDSGGDFHADADRLSAQLEGLGFSPILKLYHPADAVRANLTQSGTWEAGFVSFSGHGTSRQLGNHQENFLNSTDAAELDNAVQPVFAAMTCSAGLDAFPGTRSLASALVLNPWGGAIASLAPTGLSSNTDAHILGGAFIDNLYGRHNTVGDALWDAKYQTRGQISDFMAPIYSVIGDPAVYP